MEPAETLDKGIIPSSATHLINNETHFPGRVNYISDVMTVALEPNGTGKKKKVIA